MAQIAAETERTEAAVTPAANPAPLGLCAFALTTFVLSAWNANLFAGASIVVGLALFYGGLAQMLAGMWEFRAGNTFGATAFTSYGAFWIAFAVTIQFKLVPNSTALGFFLLAWAIFTGIMFLGSLRTNIALMGVFLFLFLTYLALAIANFGGGTTFAVIGGWLGIVTALIAWYAGMAGLLASGKSAFTLPVGPRA